MTLPSSGPLSLQQINAEFARGLNLNSYRGTVWYTDAGASGGGRNGAPFAGIGSGGGGGYVQKTYNPGDITTGASIALSVGSGGLGAVLGSGSGASGRIYISWT